MVLEEEACNAMKLDARVKDLEIENNKLRFELVALSKNCQEFVQKSWPEDGTAFPEANASSKLIRDKLDDFSSLLKNYIDEMDLHDDEETTPKADVLWFAKELSWRFDQIQTLEKKHLQDIKFSLQQIFQSNSTSQSPSQEQESTCQQDESSQKRIQELESSLYELNLQLEQSKEGFDTTLDEYRNKLEKNNQQENDSQERIQYLECALTALHNELLSLKKRKRTACTNKTDEKYSQDQEEKIIELALKLQKSEIQRADVIETLKREREGYTQKLQIFKESFQNYISQNDK